MQVGTPPNAKSARNVKARLRKDPTTPKGVGRREGVRGGADTDGETTGNAASEAKVRILYVRVGMIQWLKYFW